MSQKMGFFVLKTSESDGAKTKLLPIVDVVVSLIVCGKRILAVYNEKWGAFTVPTTKRRAWEDANAAAGAVREEEWDDAAARAAAEWLGRTTTEALEPMGEVPEFQQSDRDGKWKRYRMRAYKVEVESEDTVCPPGPAEWLTAEQFAEKTRRPLSPTARHVVAELYAAGKL